MDLQRHKSNSCCCSCCSWHLQSITGNSQFDSQINSCTQN